MRVVVTGASGNAGTSVLHALEHEPAVESVLGVARRMPELSLPKVEWARADVSRDELVPHFRGADAVVHLAWLIQPSRDAARRSATNVAGKRRVFEAVGRGGRSGARLRLVGRRYSPGPKDRASTRAGPTAASGPRSTRATRRRWSGCSTSSRRSPVRADGRLRPGLIFKRDAARNPAAVRRAASAEPARAPGPLPVVPDAPRLRFQAVHSHDVGDAYRLAVVGDARGAFNVAAEPVLDPAALGELLGARPVPVRGEVLRAATALSWRARLQPSPEAGSTWRSACRSWTPPVRGGARLGAAPRGRRGAARTARRHARWRGLPNPAAGPRRFAIARAADRRRRALSRLTRLLTTVIGSYPQPDWLIDREKLRGSLPAARAHAGAVARRGARTSPRRRTTPPRSRSATRSAPASTSSPTARSAARATPTASRPRSRASTSTTRRWSRAAPAARTRCRAIVGKVRRTRAVEVDDLRFLRATPTARSRSRCPARSR